MTEQLQNASQYPRIFYARHMQPGVVKYNNGTVLVDVQGMKNLALSAKNRSIPVYIGHKDKVNLQNIKEEAEGYVCDSFYNEKDGWAWFKFIAIDDKVYNAIKKGFSVSNCYNVTQWGNGGTKNNCAYKQEILNGEFEHLAIVPDPRYENSCIMTPEEFKKYQDGLDKQLNELRNSKSEEKKPMFKFFKNEKKEVTGADIDLDTSVELEGGTSVTLRQMVNSVSEAQKKEADEKKLKVGETDMTVEELMDAFKAINSKGKKKNKKKNGESEAKTPDEEDEGEEVSGDQDEEGDDEIGTDKANKKNKKKNKKKNAGDEEDDCMANEADADEKKKNDKGGDTQEVEVNDKFFNDLRNAHLTNNKQVAAQPRVMVSIDRVELGKKRYGSGE